MNCIDCIIILRVMKKKVRNKNREIISSDERLVEIIICIILAILKSLLQGHIPSYEWLRRSSSSRKIYYQLIIKKLRETLLSSFRLLTGNNLRFLFALDLTIRLIFLSIRLTVLACFLLSFLIGYIIKGQLVKVSHGNL